MARLSFFVKRMSFKKGDFIFKINDKRDVAYIIEKGQVNLFGRASESQHNPSITIGDGEIFGESAILEGGCRSASAVAETDVDAFVLSRSVLQSRMDELDPLVHLIISMLLDKYCRSRLVEAGAVPQDKKFEFSDTEKQLVTAYEEQKKVVLKELQMEQELRRALENRELKAYLQPIIDFATGCVRGYETLVRWHHPEKGVIFPNDFIPIAERTHVVQLIDERMLEAACALVPRLQDIAGDDAKDMFISVNLSGANFDDETVVARVIKALGKANFDPKQIKLEITESALVNDAEQATRILSKLKKTGVQIALDDFGTGYSSLGYLHKFQIDTLKIDRSFVTELNESEKALDIIKAVVGLAHTFNLDIVAEGIEQPNEIEVLKNLGCQYGQGYYFGKPIFYEEALTELKAIFDDKDSKGNIIMFKALQSKNS